ncbi:NADPH:quinone oxidoreductase family protein [Alphaproteobacteria bacterium]|jgi:NADPH2:quinone reductase|nr:NADPH:quinone oxidoreductase family protein [Alphaproteobacteria bacterium]
MKALVCKEFGPAKNLKVEEMNEPIPNSDEVCIKVHAAGVNFPDILMVEGKYQVKPAFPFAPGAEAAGEIISIGENITKYKIGQRVIAMTGHGAFAEIVKASEKKIIPLNDNVDFETASILPMVYGTSAHALIQRGKLKKGETLLVHGAAGGVGLAAVEIGKAMGARVIATASTDEKCQVAREHGADETINYSNGQFKEIVKSMTDGKGADVIYDPVGGDVFDQSLRCIAWEGRLLVVGFTSGRIPSAPANLALLKSCDIVGVFWGAFVERTPHINLENFEKLYKWIDEGFIKPRISMKVSLENTLDAMQAIADRKIIGKAIVKI